MMRCVYLIVVLVGIITGRRPTTADPSVWWGW